MINPHTRQRIDRFFGSQLANVAGAFLSKGGAAAIQFVQAIVLSRTLGADALGIYYFALSVYRVAEATIPFGIPMATVKEVASAHAHNAWGTIKAVSARSVGICLGLALPGMLIVWLLANPVAHTFKEQPLAESAIRWMALALIPGCVALAMTSVLRGTGRQITANILGSMVLPLAATLSFLLLWRNASYLGAVYAFILGQAVTVIALSLAVWKLCARKPDDTAPSHSLFQSAAAFWIVTIASLGNDSLGVLMLGIFGTAEDAGVFGVAVRLAMPLSFLGSSVQAVCEPKFAGLHRIGQMTQLRAEYWTALRNAATLAIAMGALMAIFASPLLSLFGKDFTQAEFPFLIILTGVCLMSACGPAGSMLAMTGHAKINAWTAVAALPLAGILMALLIPDFGPVGAALATSLALSLRVAVQFVAATREIRKIA